MSTVGLNWWLLRMTIYHGGVDSYERGTPRPSQNGVSHIASAVPNTRSPPADDDWKLFLIVGDEFNKCIRAHETGGW